MLTLEDRVKREQEQQKARRTARLSIMAAVLGNSKSFVLFERVKVDGKGNGMVAGKVVETGPNAGCHRVRLDSGKDVFAKPENMTQLRQNAIA
mmetsp:Transcript_28346/g.46111  ORF Transcript_28346/g.46111 Transcript_28346/m.46111 type:complete len:93 (+) Transcript_28346:68-346(+)